MKLNAFSSIVSGSHLACPVFTLINLFFIYAKILICLEVLENMFRFGAYEKHYIQCRAILCFFFKLLGNSKLVSRN